MLSRRERRQFSADMELGRRHPYLYGIGPMPVVAAVIVLGMVVAFLVSWARWPDGTAQALKWAAWSVGGLVFAWLFWLVALRPRR